MAIGALRGRFMKKRRSTDQGDSIVLQPVTVQVEESAEIVDQDELQLKDELNKEWVLAWLNEVNGQTIKLHKRARKTKTA
jgi:hypothetical protein